MNPVDDCLLRLDVEATHSFGIITATLHVHNSNNNQEQQRQEEFT